MAVTGTSVAAAATMLAAAAAIFVTLVLCFYLFLCAKRYRGAAPTLAGGRARFVFASATGAGDGGGGMAEQAIAALPRKEVAPWEDPAADCAVCLAELAAGEAARVLPRCGHAFHVACVDVWLRAHSTCPLCRCAVVDDEVEVEVEAAAARAPEADLESPAFPTNVLFFGSQDTFSTRGAAATASLSPLAREPPRLSPPPPQRPQHPAPGPIAGVAAVVEAARAAALRRLLACRGATPVSPSSSTPQRGGGRDLESGESSGSPPAKPPQSGS